VWGGLNRNHNDYDNVRERGNQNQLFELAWEKWQETVYCDQQLKSTIFAKLK
jgi:hypothetical protein